MQLLRTANQSIGRGITTAAKGIIISGGRIEDDFACEYLSGEGIATGDNKLTGIKAEPGIIAADKGLEFCRRHGILPAHIVGDFDSAKEDLADEYKKLRDVSVTVYPRKKDYTDTHIAVELAIELGMKEITVLGATGAREDHFLGNLQVMEFALRRGAAMQILDEHNRIRMTDSEMIIPAEKQFG